MYLREDFKRAWEGKDPFTVLNTVEGETYRALEARRTFCFELEGKSFFAKVHGGVGWKEIVENWLHARKPVLGARNEWEALNNLHELGLDTMTPVGFGEKGHNPATQKSFLITEALEGMVTLEDFCADWKKKRPDFAFRLALVAKLAHISQQIHENGINHRDYYLCHFMMPETVNCQPERLRLYLIDLHRAQIRQMTPERWRIKDLSGLYFSSMDAGVTRHDVFRFIRAYTGLPLRQALQTFHARWEKTEKKAEALYQRMVRKGIPTGGQSSQ